MYDILKPVFLGGPKLSQIVQGAQWKNLAIERTNTLISPIPTKIYWKLSLSWSWVHRKYLEATTKFFQPVQQNNKYTSYCVARGNWILQQRTKLREPNTADSKKRSEYQIIRSAFAAFQKFYSFLYLHCNSQNFIHNCLSFRCHFLSMIKYFQL